MAEESKRPSSSEKDTSAGAKPGNWSQTSVKVRRRSFPGPADARESLRVAISREAYAELTAHAKESLNAEVCGVLVGDLCEDDSGRFVAVEAIIRGTAARKGATHVTFTQETWNQIHSEREKLYPKRQIVGWYHTHPGFGVEFSEMDRFIQRNFFSGASQIAFVSDPLGGQEAILINSNAGIKGVSRFWVDGREKRCQNPDEADADTSDDAKPSSRASDEAIKSLDGRISQLMQMVDAQAASQQRFLLTIGMIVAIGFIAIFGWNIYKSYTTDVRPPELQSFVPIPVQIGDKTVLLGVGIVKWEVPPKLNAAMLQLERQRQAAEAEEQKKRRAAAPATTAATAPATAPTTAPKGK